MKQILIIGLLVFSCFVVKADMWRPAYQYDQYSENGNYYFKSIPFFNRNSTDFGKTYVYKTNSNKKIYEIENYLPSKSYIGNNGKSLFTVNYWMVTEAILETQTLIKIYLNNGKTREYFLNDLIQDKSKLKESTSHTIWYKKVFSEKNKLNIITLDGNIIKINLNNGKIKSIKKCNDCSSIQIEEQPKSIVYTDIKYPEGDIFPDLVNGRTFREAFINDLNKKEVEKYSDCKYYVLIYGAIDKSGNCEIFSLRSFLNNVENEEWKSQVENWVISQKYKTDLIPVNCDKWVFEEYFYLI